MNYAHNKLVYVHMYMYYVLIMGVSQIWVVRQKGGKLVVRWSPWVTMLCHRWQKLTTDMNTPHQPLIGHQPSSGPLIGHQVPSVIGDHWYEWLIIHGCLISQPFSIIAITFSWFRNLWDWIGQNVSIGFTNKMMIAGWSRVKVSLQCLSWW